MVITLSGILHFLQIHQQQQQLSTFLLNKLHVFSDSQKRLSRSINKNFAIANRSCISCAHNTPRASIAVYYCDLKCRLEVTVKVIKNGTI